MSLEIYNVYFSGQMLKDQDPAEVRNKVGAMFKLDGAALERLFSGQAIAIKKGIDMDQAVKYRIAFREAGALVEIRPVSAAPTASAPVRDLGSETQSGGFELSQPRRYDLSDCAPVITPQKIPDISALDLDKPGVILEEYSPPQSLMIDTTGLKLDNSGVILDNTPPPTPVEIDTSELILIPPKEGSLEDCQQAVTPIPLPNIDHLKITEQGENLHGRARFNISED